MNRRCFLETSTVVAGLSVLPMLNRCARSKRPPNIIFILADDLGFMDVNCYAAGMTGESPEKMYYETPHIDALAAKGVAFSQAYATQLCSPTRASLLTGKFASRLGFTTATPNTKTWYSENRTPPDGWHPLDVIDHHDKIAESSPLLNATSCTGLASGQVSDGGRDETTIAEALTGYRSAFLGKWHVGGHGARGYTPADQGFEAIAWLDAGGSPYFNWRDKWDQEELHYPAMPQDRLYRGKSGKPTGKSYLTDDLTEQALDFLESNRDTDKPFFLYFCHFAVHSPWQGHPDYDAHFRSKSTRGWHDHNHFAYASMITALDNSVGAIVHKLRELRMVEDTVIVFMSDNGGLEKIRHFVITSNAPLKGGKACLTEGGVRVPCIVVDPRNPRNGVWSDVPVNCTDIFPTLLDLAGLDPSSYYDHIDGRSFRSLLYDPENKSGAFGDKPIFWHYPFNVQIRNPDDGIPLTPHSAIRRGDYKLIVEWAGNLKLYNIAEDISESRNLALEMPALREALLEELIDWLHVNVHPRYYPQINADYDPAKDPREYAFSGLIERLVGGD